MVEPVPIIDIPELGSMSAPKICEELKIKGQNDKELLAKAKEMCYTKGFYEGKMIIGEHAGKPVQEAKPLVKQQLVNANLAVTYFEPENKVISRSGEECVVAFLDQWYLNYADPGWKAVVKKHLQ